MRVLVVGSGGREHALAWKLRQSPHVSELFVAPGNGGTASIATNVAVKATDLDAVVEEAKSRAVDFVVVGPEDPLAAGLADRLRDAGISTYGPSAAAAQVEASKSWAKSLMESAGISVGKGRTFTEAADGESFIASLDPPIVVKADGLAAGKGVVIAQTRDEATAALRSMLVDRAFGAAGATVIVEEFLEGREISSHAITDGVNVVPMPFARDHKRVFDADEGPNTGGMGVYSPVPEGDDAFAAMVLDRVTRPLVRALDAAHARYVGTIYPGLMITRSGAKVLEVNCRFGDPETEVLLPRLESDLFELLYAAAAGSLEGVEARWSAKAAVGVVLASGGYPGEYRTGFAISGLDAASEHALVFHAGTHAEDGRVVTSGGRVLTVVGIGATLAEARDRAYAGVRCIEFEGMHYRTDIAAGL